MKKIKPPELSHRLSCSLSVHGLQVQGVHFLRDQNSPVTRRRMASTAMRLQIDTHQPHRVGQMPGTGRKGQDLGRWSGLTRPNQGPRLERRSH